MRLLSRRAVAALATIASLITISTALADVRAQPGSAAAAATVAAPGAVPVVAPASAPSRHRPLRQNQPPAPPQPAEPQLFSGYPGATPFSVVARKPELALMPCSQCHSVLPLNREPRALVAAPHVASMAHGAGRFWCLDCHVAENRDLLRGVDGRRIDFDQSPLLCGQCHGARHRDWVFGGHGKRALNWNGERTLYACTHCHDAHDPKIPPRAPQKPPPIRAGLEPTPRTPAHAAPAWQRAASGAP